MRFVEVSDSISTHKRPPKWKVDRLYFQAETFNGPLAPGWLGSIHFLNNQHFNRLPALHQFQAELL